MSTTEVIAILVAISGCLGVYFQARQARAAEAQLNKEVNSLAEVVARLDLERKERQHALEAERKTREQQMGERVQAEKTFGASQSLQEFLAVVEAANSCADRQLAMHEQVAMLYLLDSVQAPQNTTPAHQHAQELFRAILRWHLAGNHLALVQRQFGTTPDDEWYDKVGAAIDEHSRRYEKAIESGKALIRAVEDSGAPPLGSGASLVEVPLRNVLPDVFAARRKWEASR